MWINEKELTCGGPEWLAGNHKRMPDADAKAANCGVRGTEVIEQTHHLELSILTLAIIRPLAPQPENTEHSVRFMQDMHCLHVRIGYLCMIVKLNMR